MHDETNFSWYAMMQSLQNYTPYQKVDYIWVHIYSHTLHLLNNASYADLGKYFLVYQRSDNLTPTDIRTAYYQNITCIIYISWTIQCPGIVLEEALNLSSDRIQNEWVLVLWPTLVHIDCVCCAVCDSEIFLYRS